MNYTALAKWIETVAEREQLGPPWNSGASPKGIGAILDLNTEPDLIRAIHHVGQRLDWFTRSTFITAFIDYLQREGHTQIDIHDLKIPDELEIANAI